MRIKSALTKADAVDLPEGQETAPLGLITSRRTTTTSRSSSTAAAASFGHIVTEEGYMQMSTSVSKERRAPPTRPRRTRKTSPWTTTSTRRITTCVRRSHRRGLRRDERPGFSDDEDGDGTRYAPASEGSGRPELTSTTRR